MNELLEKFGINASTELWDGAESLPYFLNGLYDLFKVNLDREYCIFAIPKDETPTIQALINHFTRIKSIARMPVVLKTNALSGERRKALIEAHIPFVATNQIYLPFMGVALQEHLYKEPTAREKLMPSAQLILFAYLYQENKKMLTSRLPELLSISAMQVTRAVRQLHRLNLFDINKEGVNVLIAGKTRQRDLFEKAKPYLINPVRDIIYIHKNEQLGDLPLSGLNALAEMSMLSAPSVLTYAYYNKSHKLDGENALIDREKQMRIEIWKYSPSALSKRMNIADPLSVIASLMDNRDERVEQAIEKVLENNLGV